MNLSKARISKHALRRFRERWYRRFHRNVQTPRMLLRKYLSSAKEVKHPEEWIDTREEKLFFSNGWFFIVDSDLTTIITILCLDLMKKKRK